MKCPTTELSLLSPVQGHISLSWRNLSKRKVQKRMWRSILLSRHFVVKPVKTLFQSTNVCPTIECSTSRTLAARASFKLLSTRFENIHSELLFACLWSDKGPIRLETCQKIYTTKFYAARILHTKTRKSSLFLPAISSKNASLSAIWPSFDLIKWVNSLTVMKKVYI